jgi:hypothetical protein
VTVFDILVELNVAAIIVITRAVLPGVIPTAILSPLAVESVSVASEKAPVVFAPIENVSLLFFFFLRTNSTVFFLRTLDFIGVWFPYQIYRHDRLVQ